MKGSPSNPNKPLIALQMTDEDIVARAATLLGLSYYGVKPQKPHHKKSFALRFRGFRAAEFMKQLKPYMGLRRQSQIDQALSTYRGILPKAVRTLDGDKIRQLRSTGLTYRAIASIIGCHHSAIAKYLTNNAPFV